MVNYGAPKTPHTIISDQYYRLIPPCFHTVEVLVAQYVMHMITCCGVKLS